VEKKVESDVRAVMRDGTAHDGHCRIMKGEPSNPHDPQQLRGKFFDLATPVWGPQTTGRLFQAYMTIESIPDFRGVHGGGSRCGRSKKTPASEPGETGEGVFRCSDL
jgi:hypothetical protein